MAVTATMILTALKDLGLRNTRPRRLIAEHLTEYSITGNDFAIEELWRELHQVEPELGRATVYRAVDVLTEQGLLDRVEFADGMRRYRVCGRKHHHHVTCAGCRRVVEVDVCLAPELLTAIEQSTNFDIEGHSLELYGRCAECRDTAQITATVTKGSTTA